MVVSLVAMISIAIFGVFQSGVSVLELVATPSPDEDVQIFFEKFSRDLQNTFRYTGIYFHGEEEKVQFPTVISTRPELGGDQGIGRVTYSYDSNERAIARLAENVSDIYEGKKSKGKPVAILHSVHSLKFEYFEYDPAQKQFGWIEDWTDEGDKKTNLLAVKLEMELDDEGGSRTITRTIATPIGGQPR